MFRFTRTALIATSTLTLVACDDEGGGGAKTSAIEDPATVQAGQTTGQQSVALTQVQPAAGAEGAQAQFTQVGNALQGFVNQHRAFKAQQMAQAQGGLSAIEQAQTAENSFSYEGGHLLATVNYADGMTSLVYNVDLQIDAIDGGTKIEGVFAIDLQTSQSNFDLDYDIDASYAGFQLDAAGCPVAGVITADYSIAVGGAFLDSLPPEARAQAAAGQAGNGRIVASYGPNCGDVAVEGT